jgi:protein-disulfide isomerase
MKKENKSNDNKTIMKEKKNLGALKNPWFYVSVVAVIAILILAYILIKPDQTGNVIREENPIVGISIDNDAVLGDDDAPITIIEFSDYECPFCTRFYLNTLPQIKSEYIDTGKVKLIYRDYPLGFHANAQKAAEAAECAGEQGKYYEMHDKLFDEGVDGGVSSFKQYAKEIGLNAEEFNECLDSGEMASEVQKDFQDGQRAGVQGTPTFFINGKILKGAQPFEVFKQIIEEEL